MSGLTSVATLRLTDILVAVWMDREPDWWFSASWKPIEQFEWQVTIFHQIPCHHALDLC